MSNMKTLQQLQASGAVGIIRVRQEGGLIETVRALQRGGLSCVEITMTTPGALRAIEETVSKAPGILMGAGTVLDAATARQAILAGAEFIVTPTVELDVIETARRYGTVVIVGAMTPTEILTAWEAGADMVKVFPAHILGPAYLKAVRGPLPQIPLVPTGGITAANTGEFVRAGAAMVCAGGWLVDEKSVADGRYEILTTRARELVDAVNATRESLVNKEAQ